MRKISSLNDDRWQIGSVKQKTFGAVDDLAEVQEWLPATVPGDVRLALLRAGQISDPFYGQNNQESQWVDACDWWYVREVELDPAARHFLIFDGIDYQSAVFWNGAELGRHVGMFSRQIYELPDQATRGQLAVRVWGSDALPRLDLGPTKRLVRDLSPRVVPGNPAFPERIATLKCQMSFGWDFAPRLRTCGIWDEAWLVQTRAVFIRNIWVRGVPDGRVIVQITVNAAEARTMKAHIDVRGKNFASETQAFEFDLDAGAGENPYQFQFQLDSPRVWNPWDRGAPNLYELELSLCDQVAECGASQLDSLTTTFGLRTIDLEPNPGAPADEPPWTFVVNGVPEFIRGANWVPADSIPARVTREDYAALLQMAREANINLLRVWGGGLREKHAFYDLCDELGILLWQEFPFSGAPFDYMERDRAFLQFTRAECGGIVRVLRNHPSLALWVGGNEYFTRANTLLVETLRTTVAEFDGTRPFKPGSPSPGEHHNWRVWHGMANTRDYRKDDAGFFGEFGLQSPPAVEALKRFMPPEALWKPGTTWKYHNAELPKLWRYAQALQRRIKSLEQFVELSQLAQLRGLQVMIEHARRHKGRVGGLAIWQFNEPWPAICWSVVDYVRAPKPAYSKIKELYNPVLISFNYPLVPRKPGAVAKGDLWIINDTLAPIQGQLLVYLNDARIFAYPIQVQANVATRVGALEVKLAAGTNALHLELQAEGRVVSTNEYDLNYCDRGEIGWVRSRAADVGARFMS